MTTKPHSMSPESALNGIRAGVDELRRDLPETAKVLDECVVYLAGLVEQLETARALLERAHTITKANYRKREGAVVQPLYNDIKAFLVSSPATKPEEA